METLNVILSGARGGQGTSTVAAALAMCAAKHAPTHLVTDDVSSLAALLGLPESTSDEVAVNDALLLTIDVSGEAAIRVVDSRVGEAAYPEGAVHLVVLRGPCYMALRSLVRRPDPRADGLVVLLEDGRSLTERDATDVSGIAAVATVAVAAVVARTIDAGLFVSRFDRLSAFSALSRYATQLFSAHSPCTSPSRPRTASFATPSHPANRPFERSVKFDTDLPVAQSATG